MHIKSVRLGHANNSSSTHSIIFVKDADLQKISDSGCYNFGWDFFTAKSKEEKINYVIAIITGNLNRFPDSSFLVSEPTEEENTFTLRKCSAGWLDSSNPHKRSFIKENVKRYFPKYLEYLDDYFSESPEIDHQSLILFPKDPMNKLSLRFMNELFDYLLNDNMVILGGNDNDGSNHPHEHYSSNLMISTFFRELKEREYSVTYDDYAEDWMIQFTNGSIFRFSFDNPIRTKKSGYPTLVDISLGSYCDAGCKFCYQSSTKDGKFSELADVKNILDVLKKNNTMEVVFGGGEPTKHPDIIKICKYAKDLGLNVGVTTKNYLYSDKGLFAYVDSLAISCNTLTDLDKAKDLKELANSRGTEVYIQNILGLYKLDDGKNNLSDFIQKMKTLNYENLTLLGYKDFGFGNKKKQKSIDKSWIDICKKSELRIGIDSVLAFEWKSELLRSGVKEEFVVSGEGKFSCYIDSLNMTLSASSFTEQNFAFIPESYLQIFRNF